jgi:hypothetical protein
MRQIRLLNEMRKLLVHVQRRRDLQRHARDAGIALLLVVLLRLARGEARVERRGARERVGGVVIGFGAAVVRGQDGLAHVAEGAGGGEGGEAGLLDWGGGEGGLREGGGARVRGARVVGDDREGLGVGF